MKERDDGYLIETEQLNADVVREYELKKGVNQSGENNVRMRIYDSANTRLLDYRVNNGTESYSFDLVAGSYTLVFEGYVGYQEFEFSCVPSFIPSNENIAEGYFNKNNDLGMATVGTNSYEFFVSKGTYYLTMDKRDGSGDYSFFVSFKDMTTTKVNSAKNLTGKKAKITWSAKKDVDGYQVQIALDKGFKKGKKTKTITSKLVKNYTFTKLKKKKTYYARVRTYKLLDGNKIYSDWSTSKKFIIKK